MESAGAMHVRMQGNMQYVFHIQIITYFYGWCTVLETLGPWCLADKKLVVPREKLERQRLKMLFFSTLMTTVEEVSCVPIKTHSQYAMTIEIDRLVMSILGSLEVVHLLLTNFHHIEL
jgi:hypothetical protein